MSLRTLFNVNGDSRVINPRNGSDQCVDLVSNQSISGIKRFLSNLITNSNVNFNTSNNIYWKLNYRIDQPQLYGAM